MFGENLAALFLLYVRPVAAISRILDGGKLWFAILAALAVSAAVHYPSLRPASPARVAIEHPTTGVPAPDDESSGVPGGSAATGFLVEAVFQWTGFMPGAFIAPLGGLAMGFIPVIVAIRAAAGFGSFSVLMRRDYLTLLMCMLFLWAAVYLPVALIEVMADVGAAHFFACVAGSLGFALMAALGLRTMLGIDFGPAVGLAVAGSIGGILGLMVWEVAGPLRSFALSPFILYYAYIMFASDMRSLGDGLRSRQHMRQQLEISTNNPRDADAHYQLGLIYQNRRQFTEAISRFKRSIEIDPKEADPHYQLGRIARQQKRIDEAIGYLTTAVALDDKLSQSEVWRELGAAYFDAGKTDEAAVALAKFVDRRPYDPEGLYYYGRALAKLGQGNEAKEHFQTAIESVKTMPPHRRAEVRQWGRAAKSELGKVG
jgi:cytochrome c-type biogenesis protein CcmH/NrfG